MPETSMQDPMTDRDTMEIDDQEADWAAAATQPDQGLTDPKSEDEAKMEVSSDDNQTKGRIAPEAKKEQRTFPRWQDGSSSDSGSEEDYDTTKILENAWTKIYKKHVDGSWNLTTIRGGVEVDLLWASDARRIPEEEQGYKGAGEEGRDLRMIHMVSQFQANMDSRGGSDCWQAEEIQKPIATRDCSSQDQRIEKASMGKDHRRLAICMIQMARLSIPIQGLVTIQNVTMKDGTIKERVILADPMTFRIVGSPIPTESFGIRLGHGMEANWINGNSHTQWIYEQITNPTPQIVGGMMTMIRQLRAIRAIVSWDGSQEAEETREMIKRIRDAKIQWAEDKDHDGRVIHVAKAILGKIERDDWYWLLRIADEIIDDDQNMITWFLGSQIVQTGILRTPIGMYDLATLWSDNEMIMPPIYEMVTDPATGSRKVIMKDQVEVLQRDGTMILKDYTEAKIIELFDEIVTWMQRKISNRTAEITGRLRMIERSKITTALTWTGSTGADVFQILAVRSKEARYQISGDDDMPMIPPRSDFATTLVGSDNKPLSEIRAWNERRSANYQLPREWLQIVYDPAEAKEQAEIFEDTMSDLHGFGDSVMRLIVKLKGSIPLHKWVQTRIHVDTMAHEIIEKVGSERAVDDSDIMGIQRGAQYKGWIDQGKRSSVRDHVDLTNADRAMISQRILSYHRQGSEPQKIQLQIFSTRLWTSDEIKQNEDLIREKLMISYASWIRPANESEI